MQNLVYRLKPLLMISIAALMALGAWSGPAQVAAEPVAQEQRPINIDVKDMAIGEVLRMLGQAGEVNIIVGEGVTGDVQSLTLRNVSVEAALRLITEAQGYSWRLADNVYVVSAAPPSELATAIEQDSAPKPVEGEEGQPPGDGNAAVPPPPTEPAPGSVSMPPAPSHRRGDEIRTDLIPLAYTNPADIALMFGGSVGESGQGMVRLQAGLHSRTGLGGLGARNASGSLLGGGMRPPPGTGLASAAFRQFAEEGLTEGGLGGGLGAGGVTGAGGALELLPEDMQAPVAIMRKNAVLVRGTPAAIDEFREILAVLDTPDKQVQINTKWIEVATTASKALGIDWAVSNGALEFFNLGFAPGEAANNGIRYGRGRFWAELAVLENNGQAIVINEPFVICTNGMPGEIAFNTEIPYFSAVITYNQFGQRSVDFTADFIPVSNNLFVTPIIYPDDSIEMYLSPQLESQVGTVEGPNGERIPIVTSQYVSTTLKVHDGETVVLGGVIRKEESINLRKTPLLAEIPIIGKFFRSKRTERSSTELLIFVTPRIIRAPTTD